MQMYCLDIDYLIISRQEYISIKLEFKQFLKRIYLMIPLFKSKVLYLVEISIIYM